MSESGYALLLKPEELGFLYACIEHKRAEYAHFLAHAGHALQAEQAALMRDCMKKADYILLAARLGAPGLFEPPGAQD